MSTAARRIALLGTLAVLLTLLFASPAAAHAELATINPANGTQLSEPPTKVQMTFTESVNLIDGGIRLVDDEGVTVPTSDPTCRKGPTWSHGGSCPPTDTRSAERPPSVLAPPRPLCPAQTALIRPAARWRPGLPRLGP